VWIRTYGCVSTIENWDAWVIRIDFLLGIHTDVCVSYG